MSREIGIEVADLTGKHPAICNSRRANLADPTKTRMATVLHSNIGESDLQSVADPMADFTPAKIPEYVTPAKAVELTGESLTTVKRNCRDGKYAGATKTLIDGVEVWQIPIASLPRHAQEKLKAEVQANFVATLASRGLDISPPNRQLAPAEYTLLWEDYERSGAVHKRRAEAAFVALCLFHDLVNAGYSIGAAEREVASKHGVSKPTLWRYRTTTQGHEKCYWVPLLSPRYKGGRPPAEFTPAAYAYILGKHLSQTNIPLTVVLKDARALAPSNGWVIPGYDAVAARLEKEPKWLDTLGRKGPKALERSYPAIHKNYKDLALHEFWESDGRKSDVFCVWPDGTIARPFIIVWREVRSRLVLGVKGFLNPSAAGVLQAFGQALARAGTAPDLARIDNGREYAAKAVTGGQQTRYRWNPVAGEQPGIMTMVGTVASWSPPGRGQDKPIESFWRFIADHCDKSFEGAYCGRNTVEKPEDFHRKHAIPLDVYAAKLTAAIEYFNNQHRHSGDGMDYRTPMEVYSALSAQTVRKAIDPAHLRLCKMGAASLKPDSKDTSYSLKLPGYGTHRYWSEAIAGMTRDVLSRKHFVYYDLDTPENPVAIYDGLKFLGDAPRFEGLPFHDEGGAGAGEHVKAKNSFMKPKKAALKILKTAAKQMDLPGLPGPTNLSGLPPPQALHAVTIEGKRPRVPEIEADLEDEWQPTGTPGEFKSTVTGRTLQERTRAVPPPISAESDDEKEEREREERLAERKRQMDIRREQNQPGYAITQPQQLKAREA